MIADEMLISTKVKKEIEKINIQCSMLKNINRQVGKK